MKMVDVVSKTHEHYVLFCGAMHVSVPIRVAQRVCVCVCARVIRWLKQGIWESPGTEISKPPDVAAMRCT